MNARHGFGDNDGLQRTALLEDQIGQRLHPILNGHAGQLLTVGKGLPVQRLHGAGNGQGGQLRTAEEGDTAHILQRTGEGDTGDGGLGKRAVLDGHNAIGDGVMAGSRTAVQQRIHVLGEQCAVTAAIGGVPRGNADTGIAGKGKRLAADLRHAGGNVHLYQLPAVFKGALAKARNAVGNDDRLQTVKSGKGIIAQLLHSGGNGIGRNVAVEALNQRGLVPIEQHVVLQAEGGVLRGERHLGCAALKGGRPDAGNAAAEGERLHLIAVAERTVMNGGNAVGNDHIPQAGP